MMGRELGEMIGTGMEDGKKEGRREKNKTEGGKDTGNVINVQMTLGDISMSSTSVKRPTGFEWASAQTRKDSVTEKKNT